MWWRPSPHTCRLGSLVEHRRGATTDLVHVIDLPRRVVQQRYRRRLHEKVVMIGGAAQERREAGDRVAHLEADSFDEEPLGGLEVGGTDDDVPELARPNGFGAAPHQRGR